MILNDIIKLGNPYYNFYILEKPANKIEEILCPLYLLKITITKTEQVFRNI